MNKERVVLIRPAYSAVYGVYRPVRHRAQRDAIPKDREIKPPLGLLYLAGALESIGAEVSIIDAEPDILTAEDIMNRIAAIKPDFVGVTATTPELYNAFEVIKQVKEYEPEIITIMGGAHVSALPEESLQECPQVDYVVVGEGEESIKRIVREQPKEKIMVSDGVSDLNKLSPPARHLLDYNKYIGSEPGLGMIKVDAIETSRGCPFNCAFCFHLHGRKVRFRDVKSVVDEIEHSHQQTGARLFHFFDDTFTLKEDRAIAICDEIIRRNLKLAFYCFTRADTMSKKLLSKMKEAGFVRITMGIESGNQAMLDRYHKGTKLEDYKKVYQWMIELDIETRGSFIIGGPYETHQTIADSIRFAKKLPLYRAGVNILTLYPGIELLDIARKGNGGLRLLSKGWKDYRRWGTSVVETDELSAADLEYYQKKFLREFYSSRKVIFYHLKLFLKGNHSYFFFRPVIYAIVDRVVSSFREFFRPHKFIPPSKKDDYQSAESMTIGSRNKAN